ncbi:hypothetical protein JGE30_24460 [Salmonella enterica subsp. enterica serovar Give]|nr:hypothetical protein [Salmonella enterica subsp. enterica serovar Give]
MVRLPGAEGHPALPAPAAFNAAPSTVVAGGPLPFYGACYICQKAGHRAAQCPSQQCYLCANIGHRAAECPLKSAATAPNAGHSPKPDVSCQGCGAPGYTVPTCPRCARRFLPLENDNAGF